MHLGFYDSEPSCLEDTHRLFDTLHEARLWLASRLDDTPAQLRRLPDPLERALQRDMPFMLSPSDLVRELNGARAQHLVNREAASVDPGRLLAFFPEENLSDGAAEAASGGFFRWDNTPSWDTWVGYFADPLPADEALARKYLVSFVPQSLIERVQHGIDVNPEQCIVWLRDTKTLLAQWLQRDPRAVAVL